MTPKGIHKQFKPKKSAWNARLQATFQRKQKIKRVEERGLIEAR
jgi:hypothetical protein